jgi:hypothetical protein
MIDENTTIDVTLNGGDTLQAIDAEIRGRIKIGEWFAEALAYLKFKKPNFGPETILGDLSPADL